MVRHALPNLERRKSATRAEYADWCKILERGQRAISRLVRDPDPDALERELVRMANSEPQKPPHLRPRNMQAESAFGAAATLLPDFLQQPAPSASSAPRGSGKSLFMKLPFEVRNMIYDHCVFYPSSKELYHVYYSRRNSQTQRFTPTIYLLSKEITREALLALRSRVLVIDRVPPWPMGRSSPLEICNFISRDTLLKVRYLELRVAFGEGDSGNGDVWLKVVRDLLRALSSRNSIIHFKVLVKVHGLQVPYVWSAELRHYEQMKQQIP
ncbi:hypothetical protein PG991_005782 [Apiospora marii]|uniref:F-box domain-containing protein n=1 Tax=Apiospora marii TaxID=335849 RepID=A0ABR1SAI0_9PEZI